MQGEEREYRPTAFPGVVVTLKSPTEREKRRLFRLGGDEMVEAALAAHVVKVTGHTCRGCTPTTAKDFIEYGDGVLVAVVASEILTEVSLTEGEGGPSGAPSGSSGAASSTEGAGTA